MTYRMTREQVIDQLRSTAAAEGFRMNGADTDAGAAKHAYAANLLARLAEQASAKRIKTPQIT